MIDASTVNGDSDIVPIDNAKKITSRFFLIDMIPLGFCYACHKNEIL